VDFIGVINQNSSVGHKFILIVTDYFTIWSKVMPCRNVDQEIVIEMIKRIITCFGIPQTIMSDNGLTFIGGNLSSLMAQYGVY